MKIVRAPLRVSLFGGGCDRPSYYEQHGCTIISFAIDRYMHVVWNPRPTGRCRLSYSKVEELDTLRDAKHTLVRACAEKYGFKEPCTLTIVSDVPKGTGLGSSSALAVCLCELVGKGNELAFSAIGLERSISPEVGWQDHLPATVGGFHKYHWMGGMIPITMLPDSATRLINEYGLLLYTDIQRDANSVLANWNNIDILHRIKALADDVATNFDKWTPGYLGEMLNETWALKSSIPGVATGELHYQHAQALSAGAIGGKLCGAGAGGCWFFLVSPLYRQDVIDELGLVEIPFKVAEKGVEEWNI